MNLSEKRIEDIIYKYPWLIDSNFIVPKIRGASKEFGRQVNVGQSKNRYIDLLLKDTRDNRPVIIELKKGKLVRENVAQILEYKALIVSLPEKDAQRWRDEFGTNYYAPKLILIGTEVDDEVVLSANLVGVQISKISGLENLEINFNSITEIDTKLNEWAEFIKSGNRTLIDRNEWLGNIIDKVNRIIDVADTPDIATINEVPSIPLSKAYWNQNFPFLNMPIWYKDERLLGFYEYYDKETPYSESWFYCDLAFLFEMKFSEENEALAEKEVDRILRKKKYNLIQTEDNWPVIKLNRNALDDDKKLEKMINGLIKDGIEILIKIKPQSTKNKRN